ncbi:MAG: glycine cleavage system protein GcvH [Halobacteriovoraceae bacterium]|jgi:glycine cleavage system H protein|nr:glycine cleavage system protein GcvH [Halobacteriovoraceae bacterium]
MSHNVPEELKYTKEHEWVAEASGIATVGITDFAQSSLGDIVFVELPEAGTELAAEATFGVVESIKSVSDLYSPLTGEVLERNDELEASPELLNSDPYQNWMLKIKISDTSQLDGLMNAADYSAHCEGQS